MKPLLLLFQFAACAAPTPPTPPAPVATSPSSSPSSRWTYKNGANEIEVQTTGDVTLDPASDALFDLHGNGTLRVSEKARKDVRVLTAEGSRVTWLVNGTARPFNAHGKDWLRQILKAQPATPTPQ